MVARPSLPMQAVWLCVFTLLSPVQCYRPFDLGSLKRDSPGSFAIDAHKNVNVQRSGPLAKIKALAKYGVPIPDSMADFAAEKGLSRSHAKKPVEARTDTSLQLAKSPRSTRPMTASGSAQSCWALPARKSCSTLTLVLLICE